MDGSGRLDKDLQIGGLFLDKLEQRLHIGHRAVHAIQAHVVHAQQDIELFSAAGVDRVLQTHLGALVEGMHRLVADLPQRISAAQAAGGKELGLAQIVRIALAHLGHISGQLQGYRVAYKDHVVKPGPLIFRYCRGNRGGVAPFDLAGQIQCFIEERGGLAASHRLVGRQKSVPGAADDPPGVQITNGRQGPVAHRVHVLEISQSA